MTTFIYGFCGALVLVGLVAGGIFIGWKLNSAHQRHSVPTAKELGEKEREDLIADQKAFRSLQHYSAEMAYNIKPDLKAEDSN